MTFEVTILGCGAATPTLRHHPSAQFVNLHDKFFLVDCGEGTQMQLRRYKVKMQRIHHIFISHLHGDHFFGLPGLLASMNLLGRDKTLHIFGPPQLENILKALQENGEFRLGFELQFHHTQANTAECILEDASLEVFSFPLDHRIPCTGFLFREKGRARNVPKSLIQELGLMVSEIVLLKKGELVRREDGTLLDPDKLLPKAPSPRAYAYCSDTKYSSKVIEAVKDCNLLYHEATFTHELIGRAEQTFHSTAKQAAEVAHLARAQQLILGHFSARYRDESVLLNEAREVFPNTELADEGKAFAVPSSS